jgi:hypothetical protein
MRYQSRQFRPDLSSDRASSYSEIWPRNPYAGGRGPNLGPCGQQRGLDGVVGMVEVAQDSKLVDQAKQGVAYALAHPDSSDDADMEEHGDA